MMMGRGPWVEQLGGRAWSALGYVTPTPSPKLNPPDSDRCPDYNLRPLSLTLTLTPTGAGAVHVRVERGGGARRTGPELGARLLGRRVARHAEHGGTQALN